LTSGAPGRIIHPAMPTAIKLLHVVGARPNFMKADALLRAGRSRGGVAQVLVHTEQHYDAVMSEAFLRALDLPEPDVRLGIGSGTHAEQTGRAMIALEPVLRNERPDWVVVYGDVNSTLAGALTAVKLGLRVAHVEAGLRSYDRAMPEEINRVLTDQIAELCLTPSDYADANLRAEGVAAERIRQVGNLLVQTLLRCVAAARGLRVAERIGVAGRPYAVATLHRVANVDRAGTLAALLAALGDLATRMPVVFPIHPRTRGRVREFGLERLLDPLMVLEPLGYVDMLSLVEPATLVLTDSGGLQQETTVLGVPCLSVRDATEWRETLSHGTNRLVRPERGAIAAAIAHALAAGPLAAGYRPPGWDGESGVRALGALLDAR
jgi:UDP-N-acetylglucosamine 2-epimerase (non-hydrolysing)